MFALLNTLFSNPGVQQAFLIPLLVLLPLEVVTGAIAAKKSGWFDWKNLADFGKSHVLPYLGMVFGAGVVAAASHQGFQGTVAAILVPVIPWAWAQVNSIADNICEILGAGDGANLVGLIQILVASLGKKPAPSAPVAPAAAEAPDAPAAPAAA